METTLKSIWPMEMPTRLALPELSVLPFEPTWMVTVVAELDENRAMPLNFELSRMRELGGQLATSAVILALIPTSTACRWRTGSTARGRAAGSSASR